MRPTPNTVRAILSLCLAAAGAFLNLRFSVNIAFGISFLPGNWLGVLAALSAPWPLGACLPAVTMLPTLALWNHPWAVAGVLLEGVMVASLARRGRVDLVILWELWYWLLAGVPIALVQYVFFLPMPLQGALAATSKQGVNAVFNAIVAVLLFYAGTYGLPVISRGGKARLKPRAKEVLVLALNLAILTPILMGIVLYAGDRKARTLKDIGEELNAAVEAAAAEGGSDGGTLPGELPDVLRRDASRRYTLMSVGDIERGAVPWYLGPDAVRLAAHGEVVFLGPGQESNPMRRWTGAVALSGFKPTDATTIFVSQPLGQAVAALNQDLSNLFLFLLLWVALAGTMVFMAASFIVRPLEALRRVAGEIQHSGDGREWPEFSILEMEDLRDSLVAMTGSLEHRSIELAEAKAAAERMLRRSEEYLSFMGHELKAPLAAVRSTLDAQASGTSPADLDLVRESLSRVLELIDDILDQAKAASGALSLRRRPFVPSEEASKLLAPFAIQARRKGLDFRLHIDHALGRLVEGDPLRFRQVLANLAGNAVKYTEAGSIAVRLEGESGTGSLTLRGSVEDTGRGIEAERLESIWRPFASAGDRSPDGQSSHGLGLSIVKGIVGAMGGSISVTSRPGAGSRFAFVLEFPYPRIDGAGDDGSNHGREASPTGGLRILIAEDDPLALAALSAFLRSLGAEVSAAASGAEALRLAEKESFDGVIMDEHMPGPAGAALAAELRALSAAKGRPAPFLVTSSAQEGAGTGWADAALPKPVGLADAAALLGRMRQS